MRLGVRHLTVVALAALCALVVHQLAYLTAYPLVAARPNIATEHGHITTQWALVTPLAVLAAAGFVVQQLRSLHVGRQLRCRDLAVVTTLLFIGQETFESLAGGDLHAVATNPAAIIGVLLAPLVAAVVVHLLHEASELIARFLEIPSVIAHGRAAVPRPAEDAPLIGRLIGASPSRGPPIRL